MEGMKRPKKPGIEKDLTLEKLILLVEDNVIQRLGITIELEDAGYVVKGASNGLEALMKAEEMTFCIVITDLNMPEMNGLELTTRLRSMPEYKDVPIIMHSCESDKFKIRSAMNAGVSQWISKSFSNELLESVRQLLDGVSVC
jgi:CheY-like chemotaxis protein